jgi:hypothetical protein
MSGSIDDLFAERDLPPLPGPELAAMRVDSLERRVAALERYVLQLQLEWQVGDKVAMLRHRLASIDRLHQDGLISAEHAARRKEELRAEAAG